MTAKQLSELIKLSEAHKCTALIDEPMSRHTTFKIGGKCEVMVFINSDMALSDIMLFCTSQSIKTCILGNGSNVLCSDNGFDGAVIVLGRDYQNIKLIGDDEIEVQAGCTLTQLCNFALDNALTGLEFAYGIPGTVGGAVYMNAGAYDGDISQVIVSAEAMDRSGTMHSFTPEDMELTYRHSVFQSMNMIITKARFRLKRGDKHNIREKMDQLMSRRKEKQPLEYPSAGSTFKRPQGAFAGKLIDDCGLRGYSVGGAQVSEKHCGFVINKNNASFEDVMTLIRSVQSIVKDKTGYTLECEIRIIN